jgi:hypothetical protein
MTILHAAALVGLRHVDAASMDEFFHTSMHVPTPDSRYEQVSQVLDHIGLDEVIKTEILGALECEAPLKKTKIKEKKRKKEKGEDKDTAIDGSAAAEPPRKAAKKGAAKDADGVPRSRGRKRTADANADADADGDADGKPPSDATPTPSAAMPKPAAAVPTPAIRLHSDFRDVRPTLVEAAAPITAPPLPDPPYSPRRVVERVVKSPDAAVGPDWLEAAVARAMEPEPESPAAPASAPSLSALYATVPKRRSLEASTATLAPSVVGAPIAPEVVVLALPAPLVGLPAPTEPDDVQAASLVPAEGQAPVALPAPPRGVTIPVCARRGTVNCDGAALR